MTAGELAQALKIPRERLEVLPALTAPLLGWYEKNARPLAWRATPEPYRIWLSEIMAQQTRVEVAQGYYLRFLAELPDTAHLAAAEESRLLKLWEGLGYYNRARNLQKAAKLVVEQYGGNLPASYDELRKLPGMGDYTAGAIASIAFGIPVPAVDGNVYRVLSRVLGSFADTSRAGVKKAFREASFLWLSREDPGGFNQSVMELGALVCLPNAPPQCLCCPLADQCVARRDGTALHLPVKADKRPRTIEQRILLFVVAENQILLFQRPEKGLLSGLYEPLNLPGPMTREQISAALANIGVQPEQMISLGGTKHLFSHIEWRMEGHLVLCNPCRTQQGVWTDLDSPEHPVPSAFRTLYKKAQKNRPGRS